MGLDAMPIRLFLDVLSKWLESLEQRRPDQARFFMNEVHSAARLLAVDPRFHRILEAVTPDSQCTPETALECMHTFFAALTEAAQPGRFRDGQSIQPRSGD